MTSAPPGILAASLVLFIVAAFKERVKNGSGSLRASGVGRVGGRVAVQRKGIKFALNKRGGNSTRKQFK